MRVTVTANRAMTLMLAVIAAALAVAVLLLTSRQPDPEIARLQSELERMRAEHRLSPLLLSRYRESICFVHGTYSYLAASGKRTRVRFSGTGFAVRARALATNRHIVEPWHESDADGMMPPGTGHRRESLVAYCPGRTEALQLNIAAVSASADVALLTYEGEPLRVLPLASQPPQPGEPVVVVGYPMGMAGMVAKSPSQVFRRLAHRERDQQTAKQLAELRLIRPSATHGHLGDVVGDKLVYDAATAPGGSGGPVFNHRGEVIAINAAYLEGFAGGTLGISVDALRPLLTPTP
jgi:serine protease Do